MKYVIEVTAKLTLEIEADSEEQAINQACEDAWQYDADELNGRVVNQIMPANEVIATLDKANKADPEPEWMKLQRRVEKAFRGGGGFRDEED